MSSKNQRNSAEAALQQLRSKLLDLTARNGLLNFRHTKRSSLRITDELPDQLLGELQNDRELMFTSVPSPTREQLIEKGYIEIDEVSQADVQLRNDPDAKKWAQELGMNADFELPDAVSVVATKDGDINPEVPVVEVPERYRDKSIQTLLFAEDLEATLRTLQKKSELAVQEMGTNILYLAFGFLQWYDSDQSDY